MQKVITLAAMLALTGCASITGEKIQPVSIVTLLDNKEVAGLGCTLTNDAGSWFVTSPGSVVVHKSTGDMAIDCKKDAVAGNAAVASKANGAVWGNILVGGLIGYVVDRQTGAGFNYPTNVTVMLRQISGAAAAPSAAPAPAPAPAAPAAPVAAQPVQKPVQQAAATPAKAVVPTAAGNPFAEEPVVSAPVSVR